MSETPTTYEIRRGKLQVPLPVDPLFSREEVLLLIPVRRHALDKWLVRHKGELDTPPYFTGPRNRSRRLFSANDVIKLRAAFIRRFR